ncbi:hypothetical protein JVT61DRAFT_12620 [Boletus reticuloceps]|uniref:HNH nuclease domain-containing protein n=1 Tax=Boletus reticuloceps TaxID=495285 RepID=A0A8I2YDN7_9AGAM|nr:hypothetical protein JVT61DRAFT_12620 [Boletus reticuloceps]
MWVSHANQRVRSPHLSQALKRDNYRCVVTGAYALDQFTDAPVMGIPLTGNLEVAHILPRSINGGVATSGSKRSEAAEVWAVMQRFGRISPLELNGDQVHRLENVITLWDGVHSLFDKLQMWFEPSDNDPYKYFVKTSFPRWGMPYLPESFIITTTDPTLPRPSPDYLRLHAACARVAHLSGAADAMYDPSFPNMICCHVALQRVACWASDHVH